MEGTLYIAGGIVFAGGISGMEPMHQLASTISQNFIYFTSSHSMNKEITIKSGEEGIQIITTQKQINYLYYNLNTTNSYYKFSGDATTYKPGSININSNLKNQGN